MDLTPKQQASEAIREAEAILIVTAQRPNVDQTAGVVALAQILRKLNKKVTAYVSDNPPASIGFITEGNLDKKFDGLRDFILKVDLSKAEVDKLKYTIEDGKLNVHVTPFKGNFAPSDITYAYGDYHYDLIISLGVSSRQRLDPVFDQNPTLLKNTPMLNLDYHRNNENFGAINLVETNATTLGEMLLSLAESLQPGMLDENIATALLAGIIASTDRFSSPNTTPKAMTVAAQLLAAGARQQQIIKALYSAKEKKPEPAKQQSKPQDRPSESLKTVYEEVKAAPPAKATEALDQVVSPAEQLNQSASVAPLAQHAYQSQAPEPSPQQAAQNPIETPQVEQNIDDQPMRQNVEVDLPNEGEETDSSGITPVNFSPNRVA